MSKTPRKGEIWKLRLGANQGRKMQILFVTDRYTSAHYLDNGKRTRYKTSTWEIRPNYFKQIREDLNEYKQ